MLQPLDDVELEEGAEVTITIADRVSRGGMVEALRASAGGWRDLVNGEELKRDLYEARLTGTRPYREPQQE